jgi:hypothetical protein
MQKFSTTTIALSMMHINIMKVCSKKAKLDIFGSISTFFAALKKQDEMGRGRDREESKIKLQL